MAYKFPWTNYHELNLDWILNTVKDLFAKTEQNNAIVEQYDGRLTEVELTADNAQTAAEQAQQNSTAALDLAQGAQTTATQAQQAAGQAQQAAGQAQQAAGQAQQAAGQAQQTATQAQQTAQNFDGRIRQAEDNAASALQAAQAFDEQVQGAISAANNANEAATAALTTSAETARELAAQRDTLEDIIENAEQSLEVDLSTKADVIINSASGNIASFNDGADDMPIKKLVVNIKPAQAGSGDPSPTNIRPISGRTGVEIEQTGKNILANDTVTKVGKNYFIGGTSASDYPHFIKAGTYTLSNSGSSAWAYCREQNGSDIVIHNGSTLSGSITLTKDGYYKLWFYTTDADASFTNIQLELGSIASTYEPFQSSQISVTFPSEAGTIYGGILTINPDRTGQLVVDKEMIVYDGSSDESWIAMSATQYGIAYFYSRAFYESWAGGRIPLEVYTNANFTCNYGIVHNYSYIDGSASTPGQNGIAISYGFRIALNGLTPDDITLDEWKSWLAENNVQLVAPILTPSTYTLTESEISGILKTLYQYNNIWSDAGSVNVEYPADTKTYIDNKFAALQALILEH